MKMNYTFRGMMACAFCASMLALTSCDDKDDNKDNQIVYLDLSEATVDYNEQGYWDKCYDVDQAGFSVGNVLFSHQASAMEWEGYTYYSWYGFCLSKSTDNKDYTAEGTWLDHQWTSITGGASDGKEKPYLVGFWKSDESADDPSCTIKLAGGKTFRPEAMSYTNNTYAYYTMKEGNAFSQKFDENSWFKLYVKGYLNGTFMGELEFSLANGTDILKEWKTVRLTSLGEVDTLVFTMASSDSGAWGMNTPGYFCLDNFVYTPGEYLPK